jgi:hypothetical protein
MTTITIKGKAGLAGPAPAHQWSGAQIRFQNPDGTWGAYTDLAILPSAAPANITANYTLQASDDGKILVNAPGTPGTAIVLTVPNNLVAGFTCTLIRGDAGTFSLAAATGATNRSNAVQVADQYNIATLYVFKNTGGSAAEFLVLGDVS